MANEKMIDIGKCCACETRVMLPEPLYKSARCDPNISFFCAYGHAQHYAKTRQESEADKLRRERDMLKQQVARVEDDARHEREMREAAERSVSAHKGQVTRLKNRAKAGVCPCCNRTFKQLAQHMANKHPSYIREADAPALAIVNGGKP